MAKIAKKGAAPVARQRHLKVVKPTENTAGEMEITDWLGNSVKSASKPLTVFDYIRIGEEGLTKRSLDDLASHLGISRKSLAENVFDISVKTLERKSPREKLSKTISSHALEIAKLLQHAYEIFRDKEKVKLWINRENKALNNRKPVELFDTLTGLNLVNDILGRIEEGVYS